MSPRLNKEALEAILGDNDRSPRRFVRAGHDIFYGPGGINDNSHAYIYNREMKNHGITHPVTDAGRFVINSHLETIIFIGGSDTLGISETPSTREETLEMVREMTGPQIEIKNIDSMKP